MVDTPAPTESDAPGASRTDFHLGVTVAIVAALVAIVDLVNGHVGNDEQVAVAEKVSAYAWFQSKGIKEAVAASERDTLHALLDAGAVDDAHRSGVEKVAQRAAADAVRYEGEKSAILEGGVIDGKPIVGARAIEARAAALNRTGDVLDIGELFLHLALLLGGVGVAVSHKGFERAVLGLVVSLGALGVGVAVYAILR